MDGVYNHGHCIDSILSCWLLIFHHTLLIHRFVILKETNTTLKSDPDGQASITETLRFLCLNER